MLSEADFQCHLRRVNSERIDFNAGKEPNTKRRSTVWGLVDDEDFCDFDMPVY